ncbi:MAG: peptide MFS transporter [Pyrinomonadaceae bacterium]|nr:peptide MFS transporter [Pyrinomonadaceae bacterium]
MSAVQDSAQPMQTKGFFGHPGGLSTLFFTEMWERFSYYGMRALLILYMTAELSKGGMALDTKTAAAIYGFYTASVYFLPLIGGWIADRFIGAKRATFIGGVIIALGHFTLAIPADPAFYAGLVLVAVGTGFLKSNISAMVGDLYEEGDARRDGGFSIFYMGINIGAFAAPLICGALAAYNWHYGFAAAGVGMVFGLIQYVVGRERLKGVGEAPVKSEATESSASPAFLAQLGVLVAVCIAIVAGYVFLYLDASMPIADRLASALKFVLPPVMIIGGLIGVLLTGMQDKLTLDDWKRVGIIIVLFCFAALFWMGFEQAGSSLNLFAEQMTERMVGSFEIPAAWFQSLNAIMIVALAPLFSIMWIKWGNKQPNDVFKFSLGLFFLALGFVVLAYASGLTGAGKVSPMWLVVVYLLHTIGELFLSPVGLSAMTKLAPGKMVGLMLGVWFLATSFGSFVGGIVAGEFEAKQETLVGLFSSVAIWSFGGAALALILSFLVAGFLRSERDKHDDGGPHITSEPA